MRREVRFCRPSLAPAELFGGLGVHPLPFGRLGSDVLRDCFSATQSRLRMSLKGRQPPKGAPRSGRLMDAAGGGAFKRPQPTSWRPVSGRQAPRTTGAVWKPSLPAHVVPTLANPGGTPDRTLRQRAGRTAAAAKRRSAASLSVPGGTDSRPCDSGVMQLSAVRSGSFVPSAPRFILRGGANGHLVAPSRGRPSVFQVHESRDELVHRGVRLDAIKGASELGHALRTRRGVAQAGLRELPVAAAALLVAGQMGL